MTNLPAGDTFNKDHFWSKVNKAGPVPTHRPDLGPCWLWTSFVEKNGYARFYLKGGKHALVHRLSYQEVFGTQTLPLDHLCRVRHCVNPRHLEPTTTGDNIRRGVSHNGSKQTCPQGHAYIEENTYLTPQGHRKCATCNRERSNQNYHRRISLAT